MVTRSEKFRSLQRRVGLYQKRGTELTDIEKQMAEYIEKSREYKQQLDLIAAQIEIQL